MSTIRYLHTAIRPVLPVRCVNTFLRISTAQFHNSALLEMRSSRDKSKGRGISAIHRRFTKPLSVSNLPLPVPVIPKESSTVTVDSDHGLYGFFGKDGKVLPTPEEDFKHGRAWSVDELRRKSWEDLHKLWWRCVKERNIMFTQSLERKRLDPGFGEYEAQGREKEINRTQRAIKHVLTERLYAWQEARELAKSDPRVDLSGNGPAYDATVPVTRKNKVPAASVIPETQTQQTAKEQAVREEVA